MIFFSSNIKIEFRMQMPEAILEAIQANSCLQTKGMFMIRNL